MASIKDISELTVAPDGCFAFVDKGSNVTITYQTPDGPREFHGFEAYAHSHGTILRFPTFQFLEKSSWTLNVSIDGVYNTLIQLPPYESHQEFWENKHVGPHEFLGFCKSVKVEPSIEKVISVDIRCDYGMYGPTPYSPTDGIKPTPLDFSWLKRTDLMGMQPLLSVSGRSHILAVHIPKIDMQWRNWPLVTLSAKTISGMLRQLSEWRDLYIAGLSEEDYAVDAHNFIEDLGITQEMIDELKNIEVPMPVERFMKSYGDPRHGFSEKGLLPSSLENHLKKNLCYKTLSSLEAVHPVHPVINENLKKQELQRHQEFLFEFATRFLADVDLDRVTTDMVYDRLNLKGQFKRQGITAFSSPEIPIATRAREAARFFNAISQQH